MKNVRTRPGGYLVRFEWGAERFEKYFATSQYASRAGARRAAVRWLKRTNRDLGRKTSEGWVQKPSKTAWHRARLIASYKRTGSATKAAAAGKMALSWATKLLREEGLKVKAPPVYSARLKSRAIALYATGLSCRLIAARLKREAGAGPSQYTVFGWIKAAGKIRTPGQAQRQRAARASGKNYRALERLACWLARRKFWSARAIALHLGVSRSTVTRWLPPEDRLSPADATERRQWVADYPDTRKRRARRTRAVALRRAGYTYREIERAVQLSRPTLGVYFREAGLTKRQPAA